MEYIRLCRHSEGNMKTSTYSKIVMVLGCCSCVLCAAEPNKRDIYDEVTLARYSSSGYLYWSSLRSTNEVLFVDCYLDLMNMATSEMKIKRRSELLKYKVQVFRDFAKSRALLKQTNAWYAAAGVLSDIRDVYCAANEEGNKAIGTRAAMSEVIVIADRKRVLRNISNEMWAAEKFVKNTLVDIVNATTDDEVSDRFLLISNLSCKASFSTEEIGAFLNKRQMPEFKNRKDFPRRLNDKGVHIKPL